jgi:hypothetical protein
VVWLKLGEPAGGDIAIANSLHFEYAPTPRHDVKRVEYGLEEVKHFRRLPFVAPRGKPVVEGDKLEGYESGRGRGWG